MSGNTVPILWFENEYGQKWFPPTDMDPYASQPDGFRYMHYRNPLEIYDEIYAGREQIMRGGCSYPANLVLALTRPNLMEKLRAIFRYGWIGPRLPLDQAILRASGCSKCLNTLSHRVGLKDGYKKDSKKDDSRTSCEYCTKEK